MELSDIRKRADMTQEEVAHKAGIGRASYTNIENGARKPSVRTAKAIAAVLGFDWTEFFNESPTRPA